MKSKLVGLLGLFVLLSIMALPPIFADQISEDISYSNLKLVQNVIPMNISSENTLPWAAVKGTIENHATGYPVIIHIALSTSRQALNLVSVRQPGIFPIRLSA